MQHDRHASHQPLAHGAKRLVSRQIGPRRTPLSRLDPLDGGPLEASGDLLVHRPRQLLKHRVHGEEVLAKRAATPERHPDRAGAKLAHHGQIVRPEVVDRVERDQALELRRAGLLTGQYPLAALGDLLPLPFDDGLVLAQKQPATQILPIGHALQVVA